MPDWRLYERLAALLEQDAIEDGRVTIVPNARLVGTVTGIARQVDVLIDSRVVDGVDRRVIVDGNLRGRPLSVGDVEAFLGMMEDCRAHRGILVCPEGWSDGAMRRAQRSVVVRIVDRARLEDLDLNSWEMCGGRCAGQGRPPATSGWVAWDSVFHVGGWDAPVSAVALGKCDVCHDFHVWCWECRKKLVLRGDEAEAKGTYRVDPLHNVPG